MMFFFSSRRRHTRLQGDWSSDVCSSDLFRQAVDILVSPQTSFQQRQAAWKQLRDAGELDQALATLKQGATNNPASAQYPTTLGEAYIYKLQTIRDFHEVSILALQADQSFNTALGLDPANWERSEEHTSELQSPCNLVCRLLLEKKKKIHIQYNR